MLYIKKNFNINELSGNEILSFINLSSIKQALNLPTPSVKKLQFMCDGFLLATILSILFLKVVRRYSFDFTSIAEDVFLWAKKNHKKIYVVGAKKKELEEFLRVIEFEYPGLCLVGSSSGYIPKEKWKDILIDIDEKRADVLLVSMGAGLQEEFLLEAIANGYRGVGFSCGGFVRQTSTSRKKQYYPKYISKLKLRAIYRMYKEPHTIKRYVIDYPINFLKLFFCLRHITVI